MCRGGRRLTCRVIDEAVGAAASGNKCRTRHVVDLGRVSEPREDSQGGGRWMYLLGTSTIPNGGHSRSINCCVAQQENATARIAPMRSRNGEVKKGRDRDLNSGSGINSPRG